MEATLRKWLRQQLLDAEESSRSWRLRAIQVEAELRSLQADSSADAEEDPDDMQVVLSQVLGLEKQRDAMEPWRARLLEDIAGAKTEAEELQRRLDELRARLPRAEREATKASREAQEAEEERARAKAAHESRCSKKAQETHDVLADAGVRPGTGLIGIRQGKAALQTFDESVEQLQGDLKETSQRRELLKMQLEELQTRHLNNIERAKRCSREIGSARQALQARQSTISKLQGEVSRSKARSERKRKQLEAQLSQSQLELRDAAARAEAAQEQLRKVKAQHARQLRVVKDQTTSLTEEWDAHIQQSEAARQEMQELQQQEFDLRSSEDRFLQQEQNLQNEAMKARQELATLEQQAHKVEDERRTLLEQLRPLEEEQDQLQVQVKAIQDLIEADSLKATEMKAAAASVNEEIAAHRKEFAAQEDELASLAALEKSVSDSRALRDRLEAQRSQLEDTSKSLQQSLEQQLGDLREAQRRSLQLKATHDDFVKLVPPATLRQVALSTAAEQALSRASRKAEQLQSCLEGGQPGGGGPPRRRPRGSGPTNGMANSTASAGLQQKLTQMAETSLREELQESRQALLNYQQKLVEESKKRAQETQQMRAERRTLEEELSKVQDDVHTMSSKSEVLVEELERHMKDLQDQAVNDAQKVEAEFSDMLQKQALERNTLRDEVEELKRVQAAERELAASSVRDRQKATEYLQELEVELTKLRHEEEELVQAHVTLKAGLLARRRPRSVPRSRRASSTAAEPQGPAASRPRPASVPGNSPRSSMCQEERVSQCSLPVSSRRSSQVVTRITTVHTPKAPSPRSLAQPVLFTNSQPCSVILSDGSVLSPDSSPRRINPLAASLPVLAPASSRAAAHTHHFAATRPASPQATLAIRSQGDKLVYTWSPGSQLERTWKQEA